KKKLADDVIADLEKWIAMGAPDPREGAVTSSKRIINIETGRQYWAFKPIAAPAPPSVKDQAWARTPVDRYILAKLEEKGLRPNQPVAKEKLIRRAYFDLVGIPPSPAEIDAFVKDSRPDAYERVIDSLLASE